EPSSSPCSSPQACKPSQADWLNDLSSTPPVSVTIATLKSSDDFSLPALLFPSSFALLSLDPPQATKIKLSDINKVNVIKNLLRTFFSSIYLICLHVLLLILIFLCISN